MLSRSARECDNARGSAKKFISVIFAYKYLPRSLQSGKRPVRIELNVNLILSNGKVVEL